MVKRDKIVKTDKIINIDNIPNDFNWKEYIE